MATILELTHHKDQQNDKSALPQMMKHLLEERKTTKRDPLSVDKVLSTPGLKNLSLAEAGDVVDTIKKITEILFEIHCYKESTCIDNQQVVCLNQENKAA